MRGKKEPKEKQIPISSAAILWSLKNDVIINANEQDDITNAPKLNMYARRIS